jgi:hypothetical protein
MAMTIEVGSSSSSPQHFSRGICSVSDGSDRSSSCRDTCGAFIMIGSICDQIGSFGSGVAAAAAEAEAMRTMP